MTSNEKTRFTIRNRLADHFDEGFADDLMSLVPPFDVSELATRAEMHAEFGSVRPFLQHCNLFQEMWEFKSKKRRSTQALGKPFGEPFSNMCQGNLSMPLQIMRSTFHFNVSLVGRATVIHDFFGLPQTNLRVSGRVQ